MTAETSNARELVAKLAAHVRPTCSELWAEAQAFLAADGVQAGEVSAYDLAVLDDAAETLDRIGEGSAGLREARARIASALSQQPEARGVVDDVIDAVRQEIGRATAKFPTWPTDPLHACGVVQEESGELAKAVLQAVYEPHKSTPEDVATEAFQTAAMAIRFLASMDRYDWKPGEQHEQGAALTEARNG